MVQVALGAAKMLEQSGISADVIDPRCMWPLDEKTLVESAKKTSRVIVVDEGYHRYGVTAEIASGIAEGAFYNLDAPVKRIGAMHVPIPFSPQLEDATIPSERQVSKGRPRSFVENDLAPRASLSFWTERPPCCRAEKSRGDHGVFSASKVFGGCHGAENLWNDGGGLRKIV